MTHCATNTSAVPPAYMACVWRRLSPFRRSLLREEPTGQVLLCKISVQLHDDGQPPDSQARYVPVLAVNYTPSINAEKPHHTSPPTQPTLLPCLRTISGGGKSSRACQIMAPSWWIKINVRFS